MNHLSYTDAELETAGGNQTAFEISHQPELWEKTSDKLFKEIKPIHHLIKQALKEVDQVILTGAGSSSFIGHCLSGVMFEHFKKPCHVIPTTDIVTFPEYYFDTSHASLIISFARSGQSPESVAALRLADQYDKTCFHLIITCDGSGALANYHSKSPVAVFTLPGDANDKGLAMTGSYTSMLLSGLLIAECYENSPSFAKEQLSLNMRLTQNLLTKDVGILKSIADKDFKRAVFLGSGALCGTAMEAALKLQELTNGKIICKFDTFLGFRHGPKAVIDEDTLVVYFFSNNQYVHQYEMDLVHGMNKGNTALFQLGISSQPLDTDRLDDKIYLCETGITLSEDFQPLSYIIPAQLLGFFKSLQFGLSPDMPSANGAISRVVEGVHIYPVNS